jgi:hypothetical protein
LDFHETVFEAVPSPLLIVDSDLGIIDFNLAAARIAEPVVLEALRPRPGEALGCIHAQAAGCGNSPACSGCSIKSSVREALNDQLVTRRTACMHLMKDGVIVENEFLISAASFTDGTERLAVLVLENISELFSLRRTFAASSLPR